jgi:hypothetical protein
MSLQDREADENVLFVHEHALRVIFGGRSDQIPACRERMNESHEALCRAFFLVSPFRDTTSPRGVGQGGKDMNSKRALPPGHENEVEHRRRLEQNLIEYFELDHSANFVQSWGRLMPFLSAEGEYR